MPPINRTPILSLIGISDMPEFQPFLDLSRHFQPFFQRMRDMAQNRMDATRNLRESMSNNAQYAKRLNPNPPERTKQPQTVGQLAGQAQPNNPNPSQPQPQQEYRPNPIRVQNPPTTPEAAGTHPAWFNSPWQQAVNRIAQAQDQNQNRNQMVMNNLLASKPTLNPANGNRASTIGTIPGLNLAVRNNL